MINYLRSLFCPHRLETIVVLEAAVGVELTAVKCQSCKRLKNYKIEV